MEKVFIKVVRWMEKLQNRQEAKVRANREKLEALKAEMRDEGFDI